MDAVEAAKYQILLLFLLAGGAGWARWRSLRRHPGESPTSGDRCGSIGWRRNKMAWGARR